MDKDRAPERIKRRREGARAEREGEEAHRERVMEKLDGIAGLLREVLEELRDPTAWARRLPGAGPPRASAVVRAAPAERR